MVTKFCVTAELLTIPAPLNVSEAIKMLVVTVIVNALAPGLKTMLLTSVSAETDTAELFETSNVAVSVLPLGTVAGIQLAAVFQSPVVGLRFQVALPAKRVEKGSRPAKSKLRVNFICPVYSEDRSKVKPIHFLPT